MRASAIVNLSASHLRDFASWKHRERMPVLRGRGPSRQAGLLTQDNQAAFQVRGAWLFHFVISGILCAVGRFRQDGSAWGGVLPSCAHVKAPVGRHGIQP